MNRVAVATALALIVSAASCDNSPTVLDAGLDAGRIPDAGSHDGPAYLVVSRVRDPEGRRIYLTVVESLEAQAIDFDRSIEVPGTSRAFTSEGYVFAMNGESLEVTRYRLGAGPALIPDGRFSMASEVSAFRSSFAFINSTRAYYLDSQELRVIVWNPDAMEIASSFDVPELSRDGFNASAGPLHVVGDRVVAAVGWDNLAASEIVPRVAALILAADRDAVIGVAESDACAVSGGSFVDDQGDVYLLGDSGGGVYDVFRPELALAPPCIVRLPRDAESLDDDAPIDMRALTGANVDSLAGTQRRVAVTRVFDPSIDPTTLVDAREYFQLEAWLWHRVNLDTMTAENLGLPPSGISFSPRVVDDELMIYQLDEETQRSTLFRVAETGPVIESIASLGEIQYVGRIQ